MRDHTCFDTLHLIVFLLGAPAVANAVLLLSRRLRVRRETYITFATFLCFLMGMTLLFTNIAASEDIYGISGEGREGVG